MCACALCWGQSQRGGPLACRTVYTDHTSIAMTCMHQLKLDMKDSVSLRRIHSEARHRVSSFDSGRQQQLDAILRLSGVSDSKTSLLDHAGRS